MVPVSGQVALQVRSSCLTDITNTNAKDNLCKYRYTRFIKDNLFLINTMRVINKYDFSQLTNDYITRLQILLLCSLTKSYCFCHSFYKLSITEYALCKELINYKKVKK